MSGYKAEHVKRKLEKGGTVRVEVEVELPISIIYHYGRVALGQVMIN